MLNIRNFIFSSLCILSFLATQNIYAALHGFETDPPGTWPGDWTTSPLFSIDSTESYHQKQSLKYSNNDPNAYSYPKYILNLEEGKHYKIGAWIKTNNLSGSGTSGAMVGLEFFDKDDNYISGYYVNGPVGTTNWTRYQGKTTQPAPPGTVKGRLLCYVKRGFTGEAWWDQAYVIPSGDVANSIFTDAYRNQAQSGTVNVKVGIDMQAIESAVMKVKDDEGTVLETINHSSMDDKFVNFSFDCTDLKAGDYELDCTLYVCDGTSQNAKLDFLKPNYTYIDEHKRLIVEGKPFFPLGMYVDYMPSYSVEGYASSGFNCLMPYTRIPTSKMDLLHKNGIKVIYSIKDLFFNMAGCTCPPEITSEADEEPYILDNCEAIRKHPALIAWYVNDERPRQELPRLIKRQNFMRKFDSRHPTWVVTNHLEDISLFMPSYDVVGSDPYPIPYSNVNQTTQHTRKTINSVFGKRPVWMVTQVFNWQVYRPNEPDLRAPSANEIRAMAWQAISSGANGLLMYSYFDLKKESDFAAKWQIVKDLSLQIKQFIPMLLSVEATPQCQYVGSDKVAWRVQQYNGFTYLFVTNGNNGPFYVTFNFNKNIISMNNEIPNGSNFNQDPSSFNCTLLAYETAVFKIKLAP